MRQGKVYYKEYLAGIITETDEGEYVFQYDDKYVKDHPNDFINFTMPGIIKSKPKAVDWIDRPFLSENMKIAYKNLLEEKYNQLGLEQ